MAANGNGAVRLTASEFSAKFSTKREVYSFLTVDAGLYCPSYDTVSIWHLRDMASGNKGNIKCRQVQHLYVPQYEELTIETITAWARQNYRQFCDRYFPVDRELLKYPRQYVINCINTNIGEPFHKWVREQIELRNERLLK
jgi:hypothetical protein